VANNATAAAAFRRIANAVRGIPEQFGTRNTLATVRVRTYSSAVGAQGTTLSSSTADTVLTPIPKVTQAVEGTPSYFGGGIFTDSTGRVLAGEYEVGPITQDSPRRRVPARRTLAPAGSVSKRVTTVPTGDEFQSGGRGVRDREARRDAASFAPCSS
jgi:hypothetical protein